MGNKAAFLESAKGRFSVREAEVAKPGDGEVVIKVFASAIQPADAKVAKDAILTMEYPTVLGSPVAGIIQELGPGANRITKGARVVCGTKIFVYKKPKYGGHQRYAVVDESEVVEIGDVDFSRAVTLGSYTPPGALFGQSTLNLHRPTFPASPLPECEQGKKIVIWGGSSAMGSLSISYAKQAGYTVISTSSPHNFDLLKSLGADHIFDHSHPETIGAIQKLFPVHYWFDTISLPSTLKTILKILAPEGGSVTKANILMLLPPAMPRMPTLPEGITAQMHRFSTHSPENADWQKWLLSTAGYLSQGIKNGVIKGVPPEVVGGLDEVAEGVDLVYEGVSGKKVVVEPWS